MGVLKFFKYLSPKRMALGFADALIDRVNEKYEVQITVRVVDIEPDIPKVELED